MIKRNNFWQVIFFAVIISQVFLPNPVRAYFYGTTKTGFEWVAKGSGGYGIYIPKSFNPEGNTTLIFSFGRSDVDSELSPDQIQSYLNLWAEEAEKRGCIIVAPYWQPVVVDSHYRAEKYFLEILDEVRGKYDISPDHTLLSGFGLGGIQAYSLGVFYPDHFKAMALIAASPLRDAIMNGLLSERQWRKFKTPILLVHGENDGVIPMTWVQEDKNLLTEHGAQVKLEVIPDMAHEHDPKVNSVILDWFESLSQI